MTTCSSAPPRSPSPVTGWVAEPVATSRTARGSPTPSSAARSPTPSTSTTPKRSRTPRWPRPCARCHTAPWRSTGRDLVADLAAQIRHGIAHARHDPFGASEPVDEFDANSHTFGLVATVGLYDALTHTRRFQGFASLQRTWLLGGDPWGVTAMVGIGHRFPLCMQHQVANLSGTLDGRPPLDVGAVVNGPNGKGNFEGGLGGFQDGMRHCAATHGLQQFDGHGSRYVDDVRSWQTDEPALDMTGAAIIAAAAQLRLHPHAHVAAHLPVSRSGRR